MGIKHPADVTLPDNINPVRLKEYPAAIETCERLRREARAYNRELKHQMSNIEAEILKLIEDEIVEVSVGKRDPQITQKKKYKSQTARDTELRIRLSNMSEYEELRQTQAAWSDRISSWTSHISRLNREYELLHSELMYHGN